MRRLRLRGTVLLSDEEIARDMYGGRQQLLRS